MAVTIEREPGFIEDVVTLTTAFSLSSRKR
jgi:hypothetical protein